MTGDTSSWPPMPPATIGMLSRRFGVSLRTLRFYEEVGLLSPSRAGGQRLYSAQDETKLRLILTGKKLGLSIRAVGEIISARQQSELHASRGIVGMLDLRTIEGQLAQLERQRIEVEIALSDLRATVRKMDNQSASPAESVEPPTVSFAHHGHRGR